jgi:hypothetical protein
MFTYCDEFSNIDDFGWHTLVSAFSAILVHAHVFICCGGPDRTSTQTGSNPTIWLLKTSARKQASLSLNQHGRDVWEEIGQE